MELAGRVLLVWLAGVFVLWLPGSLLGSLRRPRRSGASGLVVDLALGFSFWPVLLLLSTSVGWSWSPGRARLLLLGLVLTRSALALRSRTRGRHPTMRRRLERGAGLLCVLALSTLSRVQQAAGFQLPPWVDPVHHTMIVRLLVDQGRLPGSYAPFIPDTAFGYHWGFHAVAAWIAWLLSVTDPFELASIVLWLGQLLQVLVVVGIYAGARALFASRLAGVAAATVAGLVSFYPAYYLAWGRDTQLAGVFLLVPLLLLLGERTSRRIPWEAALLMAGLLLTHVRVAFLGALAAPALAMALGRRRAARAVGRWVMAAFLAALLVSPWLVRLQRSGAVPRATLAVGSERWSDYNRPPVELLQAPGNRELIALASFGMTAFLGLLPMPPAETALFVTFWAYCVFRARRDAARPGALPFPGVALGALYGWVGVAALSLNLDRLGLPPLRAVPNSAAFMLVFLPVSLACGGIVAWLAGPLRLTPVLTVGLVLATGLAGASAMLDLVTWKTVLVSDADVAALRWIRRGTPADARFAIRAMPWVGGTYVGRDGGYWLSVLTDRSSVLPPALYPYTRDEDLRKRITDLGTRLAGSPSLDAPGLREALRREGVTHLFVGSTPGPLQASDPGGRSFARCLYRDGPVAVFALDP